MSGHGRYAGAVLMAPMVKISDKLKPPKIVERILTAFSSWFPLAPLAVSGDLIGGCTSDKEMVKEWRYVQVVLIAPSIEVLARFQGATVFWVEFHAFCGDSPLSFGCVEDRAAD